MLDLLLFLGLMGMLVGLAALIIGKIPIIKIHSRKKEKSISNHKDSKGVDFIRQASKFLLGKKILSGKADFISMAKAGDKKVLQDFVNAIIERIEIKDRRVTAIHFIGGITHRFLYRVKSED